MILFVTFLNFFPKKALSFQVYRISSDPIWPRWRSGKDTVHDDVTTVFLATKMLILSCEGPDYVIFIFVNTFIGKSFQ